jgi:sugar lactone lactonase YvrE
MNKAITMAALSAASILVSVTASGHPGAALQTVEALTVGDVPESIAFDGAGNLYYSNLATIHVRTPGGVDSVFSTLPIPVFALGVKVGPDGCVYNTSVSLDPSVVGAFVWRTCAAGSVAQPFAALDPAGGPNDLAFDEEGNLFVTDPFLGKIWKVTPQGQASTWLTSALFNGNATTPFLGFHAAGVDGIAFDEEQKNLYVTNLDYGTILRVPIRHDGAAGAPAVFASDPRLQGADGIAFDDDGALFVAVNGQDRLVSIAPSGRLTVLAEGGLLDGVSSVAFGTRHHDKRTLYVASSAFTRTFGFQTGTPHPALLRTTSAL